jgi:hypothetical protein
MAQIQQHGALIDKQVRETLQRVDDHKVRLRRMIMQGCATQFAEDALRELQATLRLMQEQERARRK